jgi:hypothetical protein
VDLEEPHQKEGALELEVTQQAVLWLAIAAIRAEKLEAV